MLKGGGAGGKGGGGPSSSKGAATEQSAAGADRNDEGATEGDQVLLIGPRSSHPTVSSIAESTSSRGGSAAEKRKSSLRWQGSLQERDTRTPEGWRMSHSSVSSIYYSAQDISELMSGDTLSDWSSDQLSSFRSYHSVRDMDRDTTSEEKDDDVFNSPQESPTCSGAPIQQTTAKKVKIANPCSSK